MTLDSSGSVPCTTFIPQVAFGGGNTSGPRRTSTCLSASGERLDFDTETFVVGPCGERSHALTSEGHDASEDGTGSGTPIVAFTQNQREEVRIVERAGTLPIEPGMHQQTFVAFSCKDHGQDAGPVSPTLRAMGHASSHANGGGQVAVAQCHGSNVGPMGTLRSGNGNEGGGVPFAAFPGLSVRRLTPRECERIMGWPDDHTRYRADGREIADGPRYRLCGNGVVASVAEWLARRIK